jgi:hypothetical protein
MVDFEIPSIIVSPIVEIFPFAEELDKELSRRPADEVVEEEEEDETPGNVVFSASGSDVDDEDEDETEEGDSEIADEFDEE